MSGNKDLDWLDVACKSLSPNGDAFVIQDRGEVPILGLTYRRPHLLRGEALVSWRVHNRGTESVRAKLSEDERRDLRVASVWLTDFVSD